MQALVGPKFCLHFRILTFQTSEGVVSDDALTRWESQFNTGGWDSFPPSCVEQEGETVHGVICVTVCKLLFLLPQINKPLLQLPDLKTSISRKPPSQAPFGFWDMLASRVKFWRIRHIYDVPWKVAHRFTCKIPYRKHYKYAWGPLATKIWTHLIKKIMAEIARDYSCIWNSAWSYVEWCF